MHSGPAPQAEDLRSWSSPVSCPEDNLSDLALPSAFRPPRFPGFRSGGEWSLERPSDADLDDEQQLSAALGVEKDQISPPLHSPDPHSASVPVPIPSAHPTTVNIAASPAAMFLSAFSPSIVPTPLPDDDGQIVAGYILGGIIGYGASSIIRRAFSASGGVVAVKIVRRSDIHKRDSPTLARKRLQHEAEVWSSLSHEHILPLFASVHTSYADFFVTLFCPAGSLYDILKRDGTPALPQDDAGMMFRQVVRGLRYLHEVAMYVHRDLKLENVLVDEMGVCKIGDFGMSRKIGEIDDDDWESDVDEQYLDPFRPGHIPIQRTASLAAPSTRRQARSSLQPPSAVARHGGPRHRNSTSSAHPTSTHVFQPGSLPYAAPELLLPQNNGPFRPHPAQDIWALGVLLYVLLTGRFPFSDSFEPRLQMKILHGTFELPSGIGKGAERVLQGCIERPTQQRWTINMVDEVAWGVGWGSEGDDVTPADTDDEFEAHCRTSTRPTSRSRSRPPPLATNQESSQEDPRTRPALEAASRRSASRAKRSQSRAPVLTHQSYTGKSVSRSMSHHNSRAPSPTPTSLALSNSIMSSADSPFLSSPTSSIDRGRRLLRHTQLLSSSRSPSPSVVPGTPADFGALFNAPLPAVDDQPDELHLDRVEEEEKRGRSKAARDISPSLLSFLASDSDNINIGVGVGHWNGSLDRSTSQADKAHAVSLCSSEKERSQSCGHNLRGSSRGPGTRRPHHHHHHHHQHVHEPYDYDHESRMKKKSGKRTGSTPPTPATPGIPWSASVHTPQTSEPPNTAAKELLKSGDLVDRLKGIVRSRSVDRGIGWL